VVCGRPWLLAGRIAPGIGEGCLKRSTAGRPGKGFDLVRARIGEGSARGWPKLIGVESWWNEGKPVGRSSGKSSNTAIISACNPNDVKVVQPRHMRSVHDEASASANIALSNDVPANLVSSRNGVAAKDTESFSAGSHLRIGIGGRVAPPPLPHHRTCGSASGGSAD
jgi:hypothetical protein